MKRKLSHLWTLLTLIFILPLVPVMGIGALGDLGSLLGGLGGLRTGSGKTVQARQGYRTDVQIVDGDAAFDTAAEVFALIGAVGTYWRVWEMTIPAQQFVHWGYGSPATPMNQGYMFFYAASAAAFDVGVVRLLQENARRTRTVPVAELADVGLHGLVAAIADPSLINKNDMVALPEKVEYPLVGEDSRIAIDYRPDVLVVETQAAFKIPITVYQ